MKSKKQGTKTLRYEIQNVVPWKIYDVRILAINIHGNTTGKIAELLIMKSKYTIQLFAFSKSNLTPRITGNCHLIYIEISFGGEVNNPIGSNKERKIISINEEIKIY